MKQITLITCLLFSGIVFSQNINIPDPVFLNKLIAAGVDTNNDGQISYSEALAVTDLNLNSTSGGPKITDMEGIQYFTNLVQLRCSNNSITTLDVTALTNLELLYCYFNQINSLNITGLDQLAIIWASWNSLTNIDLTGLDNLLYLWIQDNYIDEIDLSGLGNLEFIMIGKNQLTEIDLSGLGNLEAIWINNNQLIEIDFSPTPNLKGIEVSYNFITELNINHLNDLASLGCSSNLIENIDISNLNNLQELSIGNNLLTEIDGSDSPALAVLSCPSNPDLEYINIKNGVISTSDPDMLFLGFNFQNLPNLKFICIDPGEEYALSESGYDPTKVVVSTTDCTMSINDFAFDSIILYPNPVKDSFTLSNIQNIMEYQVYDILGKTHIKISDSKILQEEVLKLNPGYYILQLTSFENQKKTIKFLKQ